MDRPGSTRNGQEAPVGGEDEGVQLSDADRDDQAAHA